MNTQNLKKNWRPIKRCAIIMMLILIPKVSVSQEAIIDTIRQTVTLPKEKVITIGKIIQNEEALFEENRLMRKAVDNLEDQLEKAERQLEVYRGKYLESNNELLGLKDKIIQNTDVLLEYEKSKRKYGLYGFAEMGTGTVDYRHFFVGAKLTNKSTMFSFTVNPINAQTVYAVGIGYRIF